MKDVVSNNQRQRIFRLVFLHSNNLHQIFFADVFLAFIWWARMWIVEKTGQPMWINELVNDVFKLRKAPSDFKWVIKILDWREASDELPKFVTRVLLSLW